MGDDRLSFHGNWQVNTLYFRDMRFFVYRGRWYRGTILGRKRIRYDAMRIIFRILDCVAVKINNDFVLSGSYPLFFVD